MESSTPVFEKKEIKIKDSLKTSWKLLKLFWQLDKKLFSALAIATILPAIIPFVNAYIYKLIIDIVIEVVNGKTLTSTFYFILGARLSTYYIQEVAFRTQGLVSRLLWTKLPMYMGQLIFTKTASLDIQYFENSEFKNLLEKVKDIYMFTPQRMIEYIFFGLQSFIQVLIALIAMAKLGWMVLLIVFLSSIPEFLNQTKQTELAWGIWDANSPFRKKFYYLANLLQDYRGIKEIKIFQLAGTFLKEIKFTQQKFYEENAVLARKFYVRDIGINAITTLFMVGVEVYVIFLALTRKVTVGDIGFYTGVVSNFQNGLGGFFKGINDVFDSALQVQNIFTLLETQPKITQKPEAVKLDLTKAPKIEFRNVNFSYPGTKEKVLKDFSIVIDPGEKIAFVGENGAGKSTLIKLLARFYDIDEGQILINGIDIRDLDLTHWHKNLGVLFQDFNKYEESVKNNIQYGKVYEQFDMEKIIRASTASGAHSVVQKLQKKYDQVLGRTFEEGIELSTGQWQKLALARGFFRNAPVLILDEPTSAIDAKAEAEIFNRVEKLSKDKTVIIISHRFSTVRNADKIYVIDNGKIVESGSHKELMKIDGQYATLFNLQAKGYK